MTATRPAPAVLEGRFIRLEPLTVEALPELFAAIGVPEVFAGGYGGGPAGYRDNLEDFVDWAKAVHRWGDGNPYLVRANGGPLDGVAIGTTTLADFDEPREHAHIGWTAYDPRVWGTQVNPEAKLLLLSLAFESGFGRVKIQGDERNARSRAAMLKLGAKFEGIVRRDMKRADGSWRDTAMYSILIDEWPDVRSGLEARLATWGDEPVRYRDRPVPDVDPAPRD
jgi:N-acetyltransferase